MNKIKSWICDRKNVVVVVALTLMMIISFLLRLKYVQNIQYNLMTDALNYHNMTIQLLNKGIFGYMSDTPNAYVTPGYPLFLALIYSISGIDRGIYTTQMVQHVLGCLSAIVMYIILYRLFGKRLIGLFGAFCMAFYPIFIMGSMVLLTECLYTFFFLLYFLIQLESINVTNDKIKKKNIIYAIISGVLFAICILIRPAMFPILIVPYLYKYLVTRKMNTVKEFGFFVGAIIILMFPWWIRNIVVLKDFVLLATQSGNPMLAGTFPYYIGMDNYVMTHSSESSEAIYRIIHGFITQPKLYLKWFTIGKINYIFYNLWYYLPGPVSVPYLTDLLKVMHYGLVSVGFLGTGFGIFYRKTRFISIFTILSVGMLLMFIPTERYSYTIMPLFIIFTAFVIDILIPKRASLDSGKQTII